MGPGASRRHTIGAQTAWRPTLSLRETSWAAAHENEQRSTGRNSPGQQAESASPRGPRPTAGVRGASCAEAEMRACSRSLPKPSAGAARHSTVMWTTVGKQHDQHNGDYSHDAPHLPHARPPLADMPRKMQRACERGCSFGALLFALGLVARPLRHHASGDAC